MHILQLANFYHPTSGGLRTAVDALGDGYANAGHRVTLVVPGRERLFSASPERDVITLPGRKLPGSGGYRAVLDRRAVAEVVESLRPDVVEVSDKTTLARTIAGLGSRPPAVLISHERLDDILGRRVGGRHRVASLTDRWTAHLSAQFEAVVCPSRFASEEFLRVTTPNLWLVPLGVDLAVFHPEARTAADETDHTDRLVLVSRLSPEKNPEEAVMALRLLRRIGRDATLTVVGDGPLRDRMRELAGDAPVEFLGHVASRKRVAEQLANADVALCPAPSETFGLSALEALACGTPVATGPTGAVGETITSTCGRQARPGRHGLASALVDLLDGDRSAQRRAARGRAEEYPWQRTVDAMLDVHSSVVERARRRALRIA